MIDFFVHASAVKHGSCHRLLASPMSNVMGVRMTMEAPLIFCLVVHRRGIPVGRIPAKQMRQRKALWLRMAGAKKKGGKRGNSQSRLRSHSETVKK